MSTPSGVSSERPGAGWWIPEQLNPHTLREGVEECRGCELHEDALHGVAGRGPVDAALMLVGEQPGDKEDQAGEPFVGPAGKLLDRALDEAGIDPESVYRTNVVKHFRFSGTRGKQRIHKSPSRVHVSACGPWLVAELHMVRPQGVILLGATAGKALYGGGFRVGDSRGTLQEWPDAFPVEVSEEAQPAWVLPTTHPAAVLRSRNRQEDHELFVRDLAVAREALR